MKKSLYLFILLLSATAWSQKAHDQYSLEAAYGMGYSPDPGITGFSHYEVGFRYMVDEYWGIKFDFGSDRFRTGSDPELGSDYKRYSVQGVHNLGRTLHLTDGAVKDVNLLAHAGMGYSSLRSTTTDAVDKIGNVIIGLTPQYYLSDSFALMADASFILNLIQQNNFEGVRPPGTKKAYEEFTGKLFTFSVGITWYFGKNKSNTDWR